MDFYRIGVRESKEGLELYPDFIIGRSQDLMVQGKTFYAIWDEEKKLWSRDEYDVQRLVDAELKKEADRLLAENGMKYSVKYLSSFNSNAWKQFRAYLAHLSDSNHVLDTKLVFSDTEVKKSDYATRRLPYALSGELCPAWEELCGTLYSSEERAKIEWAIGAILSGDSKKIQKFMVFYGPAGSGKSTILNIIEKLFEGYTTTFDGKALGSTNASFATEVFKHNPLVAIQHDGDLSKIEDNTRLNSIISHEFMTMNEKYKPSYTARVIAMLFLGSNQPVKISDAKSGIIRRLIDVHPTGVKFSAQHYHTLMSQIDFELGAIASHCLKVYLELGKNHYNSYRPLEMMLQTDVFFNFIEAHYDVFSGQGYTTLKQAYALYKEYCADTGIERPLPQYKIREELRNYFDDFKERGEVDGEVIRSVYLGFNANKFKAPSARGTTAFSLVLDETESLLDREFSERLAQLASPNGTMYKKWADVTTTLVAIDTSKLHWVRVPEKHIVIDFDLKDEKGAKSLERNLEAASLWPATYAELSQSGAGIHLHYTYSGDPSELAVQYSDGIEVKVFGGDSSLRRMRTRCNAVPISTISSGLPLKPKKEKMLETKTITSERGLRELIERNLQKKIHPGTKPSVDFIKKILGEAYESGMPYDLTDLRPRIMAFAVNSSNQAAICLKVVQQMQFASEAEVGADPDAVVQVTDDRIVFYDVEVYRNLFIICWKFLGSDEVVRMINPKAHEVEALFKLKLVGFYNRRYDNHIVYAAAMGYTNIQLFALSQALIVENKRSAPFPAAYNLSYADIWDFSSVKQSLKRFEIDLGILHMELDIPWDEPVDEKDWPRVVDYCVNDVRATEAVFEARRADFTARQILAELSGLSVNDTTQRHTAKIIFGDDKKPQDKFVYTDLSQEFQGYTFEMGKSSYKGEDPGEGGYVYAEPGMYENVALLDIASMHPTTIEVLNAFGPYTSKFSDLKKARIAIKRKDYAAARQMLDGKLVPYLEDETAADALSYALKIVINIVYGLTSAKFDNPFRDPRNIDNIVAKRGALFMIDLKLRLQAGGATVVHIKTDSIKVLAVPDEPKGTELLAFIEQFGAVNGYDFEHEATYERFCLVNDAVYVARDNGKWKVTGAQFAHPYVFKTLFSKEDLVFDDFCEGKNVVQGTMYMCSAEEEEHVAATEGSPDHRRMRHLGKTGRFVPVLAGGGILYRVKDDKYHAVTGTKGYYWIDAEIAKTRNDLEIDMSYFEKLAADAVKQIEKFGSFEEFIR